MIKKEKNNVLQTYGNANLRQHSAAVKRLLLLVSNVKSYQPHHLASENQESIGVITWQFQYFINIAFLIHICKILKLPGENTNTFLGF